MDINAAVQLISNVGFPICACFFMAYYMDKTTKAHNEEVKALTESLNNNTMALQELSRQIKGD